MPAIGMTVLHGIASLCRSLARYAPTRRLAGIVLACSPVWLFSRSAAGQVAAAVIVALILLAVLIDALRIPGTEAVSITRSVPGAIGIGDTHEARYHIVSSWPQLLRATISHRLPAQIVAPLAHATFLLEPGAVKEIPFELTGHARGIFPLGPTALTMFGPWRLMRHSLIYYLNDTISIAPSMRSADRYRLLAAQHRVRVAGQRVIRRRGAGAAFSSLRDYTPGDDPRRIDWKATARRNRLISREFSVEQGQTMMIAIDAGRMMTQLSGDQSRFEWALMAAITVADVALSAGDRVGLIVFNTSVQRYLSPSREPGTITAIRDALVGVTATLTEPDYAAAFRTLVERNRRRSLIVLFTDVVDARSSRALIALTARSAERHLPLVVALRNEELIAAAIPPTSSSDERSYASVAAEELLSAREEALQNMRQAGVAVLDTSPETMTAALINRYLEIKERSTL
ncbi:MAG: DUF58 domain-containing protein [Gemmatimonadaceae bacterium]